MKAMSWIGSLQGVFKIFWKQKRESQGSTVGRPHIHNPGLHHRHVAACYFKHITPAETGLDSDVILHWPRALAKQEQAVAREHRLEREGPTLHCHRTFRAGFPTMLSGRSTGSQPAYGQGSRTYYQLSCNSALAGGFTPKMVLGERKMFTHPYSKSLQLVASGPLRPGPHESQAAVLAEAHYLCGPEGQW